MASDSDRDDAFDEDMEALRRACMIAGARPEDIDGAAADSGQESSDADDIDLPRRLQERFCIPPTSVQSADVVKPLKILLPYDSDEDDFETLHAIQRRFEQYQNESSRKLQSEFVATGTPSGQGLQKNIFNAQTLNQEYSVEDNAASELTSDDVNLDTLLDDKWKNQPGDGTGRYSATSGMQSQFPRSCQLLFDALKKNRSYQKFIRNKMIHIEAKIAENKDLKERIKCLLDFQAGCKRRAGVSLSQKKDPRVRLISLPKPGAASKASTVKSMYAGPAENSHVEKYKMVLMKLPVSLSRQPWSTSDTEKLTKGIKQQYQEMLMLNSMEALGDQGASLEDSNMLALSSISDFDVASENFRSFLPLVNWDRLASMYFTGRTGAECEARWLNSDDPLINNSPWTTFEEKDLLFICQNGGVFNWIDISVRLGTHRTPFQCLSHYQRSLNVHILKKDWTEEEDSQLRAAVEQFGQNWQLVASCLEGRAGVQCSNRWRKTLNPDRKRVGRWSIDEDKRLKVAVLLFGAKNWNKIAQFAPGRTQAQCRERWVNCLDPSLNLKPWTEEEDSKLKDAIAEFGYCWSKVAALVPPRTDNQCRRRWKVLFPHEVPLLQAARNMQKAVLISNFVDREKERPLIGPNDFYSTRVQEISAPETEKTSRKRKKPSSGRPTCVNSTSQESERNDQIVPFGDKHVLEKEKKNRRKPLSKRGKRIQSAPDNDIIHVEPIMVGFTDKESATLNGESWSTTVGTNRCAVGAENHDQVLPCVTGDHMKLLEFDTIPNKEKKFRRKLPSKRGNFIQSTDNCDTALHVVHTMSDSACIEHTASDGRLSGLNDVSQSKVVDATSCSQIAGSSDRGACLNSIADRMKLSDYIDMFKSQKKLLSARKRCAQSSTHALHLEPILSESTYSEHAASDGVPRLDDFLQPKASEGRCHEESTARMIESECQLLLHSAFQTNVLESIPEIVVDVDHVDGSDTGRDSTGNQMKLSEYIAMLKKQKRSQNKLHSAFQANVLENIPEIIVDVDHVDGSDTRLDSTGNQMKLSEYIAVLKKQKRRQNKLLSGKARCVQTSATHALHLDPTLSGDTNSEHAALEGVSRSDDCLQLKALREAAVKKLQG